MSVIRKEFFSTQVCTHNNIQEMMEWKEIAVEEVLKFMRERKLEGGT